MAVEVQFEFEFNCSNCGAKLEDITQERGYSTKFLVALCDTCKEAIQAVSYEEGLNDGAQDMYSDEEVDSKLEALKEELEQEKEKAVEEAYQNGYMEGQKDEVNRLQELKKLEG